MRDEHMEEFIVEVSEGKWASGLAKSDVQYVLEQMLMYIRIGLKSYTRVILGRMTFGESSRLEMLSFRIDLWRARLEY